MSYLHSLCLFVQSLPPVVCRRAHVLFTFFVFVCVYLQLFVGGLMSYLHSLCLSLPPVVCRRAHVLFTFFVFVCGVQHICLVCLLLACPVLLSVSHIVFLFFFRFSCTPYVAIFSGLTIFDVCVCVCVCATHIAVGQGTGVHPVGFVLINLKFSAKYFVDRCCFVLF